MKPYTTIPNNIGKYLIPADVYRFTCLSFYPREYGITDSTFQQIANLTKEKSLHTIKDFVNRLRESEFIKIETVAVSRDKMRNKYHIPHYNVNFKMIGLDIIDLEVPNPVKGFLVMLAGQCINKERICKYTQVKLAELFNMHRNTVGKYIKELIAFGLIVKIKGGFEITTPIIRIKTDWDIEMEEAQIIIDTFPPEHFSHKIKFKGIKHPVKYLKSSLIKGKPIDKNKDTIEEIIL